MRCEVKKKTPTHDLSWYIKWLATFTIIVGAVFNSYAIEPYNLFIMAAGVSLWLCVGLLWFDRALIVLNSAILVIYFSGIIMHFGYR
jgi:energy-coupling factor transporter transmembrane protein EcfT